MYKIQKHAVNKLHINKSVQGMTIEQKIAKIKDGKERITDGAPIIYEERKAGVNPAHDVRTDRFMVAIEASDKIAKSYAAKREERISKSETNKKGVGEPEPTQGNQQQNDAGGQGTTGKK